jgi:hypothetical protein
MEKKQIILPSKKFFGSTDEDLNLKISLDESQNLLREGERTIILDTSVLFSKERNESTFYKIHGKLKMIFRNLYSGTTGYQPLKKNLYLIYDDTINFDGHIPYNEFAFLRTDVKRETNNPVTTSVLSAFTQNIIIKDENEHVEIIQSYAVHCVLLHRHTTAQSNHQSTHAFWACWFACSPR